MARTSKEARLIADAEERASNAAAKSAQSAQDEAKWTKLGLKNQGISLAQYEKALAARRKTKVEEEKIEASRKRQVTSDKKTRDLARDYNKFLKSNSGALLSQLGIASDTNSLELKARDAAIESTKWKGRGKGVIEKRFRAEQEGYNLAAQARKDAMAEIESGTFDEETFGESLAAQLDGVKGMTKKARDEILSGSKEWAKDTGTVIESAGGGEDFSKKMEMSKESMAQIDGFKDKIFKVKSFLTDPKFRSMMLKGMFIGLAVKAAQALGEALKAGFDFAREMGISMSSMPLAVGIAKEEAGALLDEFKSLEGVTSGNLLNMKWNAYWTGVSAADSAKLAKLQMSITDSSLEMALDDQAKFMKELKNEGLSASKVMADMAGHSEFIAKYMKDGGDNMEAAAKYAASIGVDLGVAESMADKLLDWESSIAAEQEASMLLGRQINLDKARQLAYSGDIEGMMREAKIQAGGEAEFAKMSVVQREALGDALGLNAVQMAELVKGQEASTAEQEKGLAAILMGVAAGALLGAVLGALAVGFGGALWGSLTFGLLSGAAIKGGLKGLGKGMLAGGGMGALAGGGIGAIGGAAYAAKGRASGGPVKAGSPYIVGERGSELFVPMTAGSIIPHAAGGAGPAIDNSDVTNGQQKQTEQLLIGLKKLGRDVEGAFAQR